MINGYKYYLLIAIQFLICFPVHSQRKPQLRFFHLGIEQGLSNNTVNCLLQDRTGFLWIGTDNGLDRYDGYQFVLIGDGTNQNTIQSPQITSLLEDKEGIIWIGTKAGGLHRYNPQTGNILHFVNNEKTQLLSDNYIRKICADNNGMLWLGTSKGLTRFNPKTYETKIFRNIPGDKNSLMENDVRALYKSRNTNGIWIGTYSKGLCFLNSETEKFKSYTYVDSLRFTPGFLHTGAISTLYEDNENRLWMGGYGGDG